MTAEQSTTVRPSAASTIRKPSVCRNIWLFLFFFFFFHPRSPLMYAASSCVSTGRQPIRIQPGLLMLWPEKLHNTGLFDLSDRIILWPAGDKIKQREFLMSLAHPSYLEPTSIQPVFPLTWQLEPFFLHLKSSHTRIWLHKVTVLELVPWTLSAPDLPTLLVSLWCRPALLKFDFMRNNRQTRIHKFFFLCMPNCLGNTSVTQSTLYIQFRTVCHHNLATHGYFPASSFPN